MLGSVLVTGATGFIGRHLCSRLVGEGWHVRGLVRPPGTSPGPGIERAVAADLSDRRAIGAAMRGVDAVIHLAARVHVMRDAASDPLAAFRRVNVEGTRTLLAEASAAGVTRFVFASSVKAMGEGGDTVWTEAAPAMPTDPYGISKLEAERVVTDFADRTGLHATILRLPLVYGPGMKGNLVRLFHLVHRGVPIPLGRVQNRRSMAYVGNVVGAILSVLRTPAAARELFLVSDGEDLSTPELIRAIGYVLGKPPRLWPVPLRLIEAAGIVGDAAARIWRGFPLTSAELRRLTGSLAVDSSKLRRVTGFVPEMTVMQGLERTAQWYLERVGAGITRSPSGIGAP
ncbi:MAG TPA: NAD-dependent epimerase/dehydratase family protein [Longimicrobiales bacterium]